MIEELNRSDCLFCRIGNMKIQADEVYRDDSIVAFLDIGPIREGHVQLIPIAHYDYFDSLPVKLLNQLTCVAQKIARVQKSVFDVERVAYLYTGGDIPQVHAHLVPLVEETDITSRRYIRNESLTFAPIESPGQIALTKTAKLISDELEKL